MGYILKFFDILTNLGASVMMPIIIMIIALALGVSFPKALRSGLTLGVGFIGLNLVVGLLGNTIGPAAEQMVKNFGLNLNILDVGWPTAAQIAFGTKVGAVIIPVCLLINIVLLVLNLTQTADIDIWNYWQIAFSGSLVTVVTGSTVCGIMAAICNFVVVLVFADITAERIEPYTNMKGVSFPHTLSVVYAVIAYPIDKILDKIPGVNKIEINADSMEKKLGVMGDPLIVGFIIGLAIGILAYGIKAYDKYLLIAVTLGATLVLIPKMADFFGQALNPLSERAQIIIDKKFKNRSKIYIGMDSAVALGNSTTIAVALILTPVMLFLAFVVPKNQFLPLTDLSSITYMMALVVPMCRENAFRSLVVGVVIIAVGLIFSTLVAPIFTEAAVQTGYTLPEGFKLISCVADGSVPIPYLLVAIGRSLKAMCPYIFGGISILAAGYNGIRIRRSVEK